MTPYRTSSAPQREPDVTLARLTRDLRARRARPAIGIAVGCALAFAPLFAREPQPTVARTTVYRVTIETPVLGGKRCLPRDGPCDF